MQIFRFLRIPSRISPLILRVSRKARHPLVKNQKRKKDKDKGQELILYANLHISRFNELSPFFFCDNSGFLMDATKKGDKKEARNHFRINKKKSGAAPPEKCFQKM